MELSGFEPLTFSMPLRRATNCAIAPYAPTIMPRLWPIRQLLDLVARPNHLIFEDVIGLELLSNWIKVCRDCRTEPSSD